MAESEKDLQSALKGDEAQGNKSLHPTGYSAAVSLVPRFTLAHPLEIWQRARLDLRFDDVGTSSVQSENDALRHGYFLSIRGAGWPLP